MTRQDAVYLAGVLDAKGRFSLTQQRVKGKHGLHHYNYGRIRVHHRDRGFVEELQRIVGAGGVTRQARTREIYTFTISAAPALALLKSVAPFLRGQEAQRHVTRLVQTAEWGTAKG